MTPCRPSWNLTAVSVYAAGHHPAALTPGGPLILETVVRSPARTSRRSRHPTDREVLRRLLLDHRPLPHGQDRRGVQLLRQRHVHEADRLGLSPVTATLSRRRPDVAAGPQPVNRACHLPINASTCAAEAV